MLSHTRLIRSVSTTFSTIVALKRSSNNNDKFEASEPKSDLSAAIIIYDVLQIFAVVLLTAVLVTAWLSPRIERSGTWFFLMISGILSSAVGLLLIGHQTDEEPPKGLCSLQAVLIYASTILLALSTFVFTLQIYLSAIVLARKSRTFSLLHICLIYAIPIFPSTITIVATSIVGARNLSLLQRDSSGMRCRVITSEIFYWTISVCCLSTFGTIVLNALITVNVRRASRNSSFQTASYIHRLPTQNAITRLLLFSFLSVLALIVAIILPSVFNRRTSHTQAIYNYSTAITSINLGLLLGVQKDIINVWTSWKSN